MKKTLTIATVLSLIIAVPSFAQSFDPDVGTGNIVPPVATEGSTSAYTQAPYDYERDMSTHIHLAECIIPRVALDTIRR